MIHGVMRDQENNMETTTEKSLEDIEYFEALLVNAIANMNTSFKVKDVMGMSESASLNLSSAAAKIGKSEIEIADETSVVAAKLEDIKTKIKNRVSLLRD